jgi:hypothetical protein
MWRKKLLNISIDRFRSVSGIPVLKIERHTAESEMRWKIPFFTLMYLGRGLIRDGILPS